MNQNNNNNVENYDNEIDLLKIFKVVWERKFFIGSFTSLAAILTVIYALNLPNVYTSSALLSPTSQDDSISSSLGGLSGLAGLAGVSLPAGNISNSQLAVKRIQSFEFFSKYVFPNIKLQNLMAVEKWDSTDDTITYDNSIYDAKSGNWNKKPSTQKSFREFKKIISISQEELTGIVHLSIDHKSPKIAKEWADLIIYNINESMRELDKQDAQNSIDFLNESSKSIKVQSIKDVVGILLESQMQTLMLASSNEAYIFKKIDSPIVPEQKSGPKRALITILGTVLGTILSLLIVLFQHTRKSYTD